MNMREMHIFSLCVCVRVTLMFSSLATRLGLRGSRQEFLWKKFCTFSRPSCSAN